MTDVATRSAISVDPGCYQVPLWPLTFLATRGIARQLQRRARGHEVTQPRGITVLQ